MIPDRDNLLPEVRLVDNYIGVLEFLVHKIGEDCDVSFLSTRFYEQLIKTRESVRDLRNCYINSLKFQNYD